MRSVANISDDEGALFFESSLSSDMAMLDGHIDFSSINHYGTSSECRKMRSKDYAAEDKSAESLLAAFNNLFQTRENDQRIDTATRVHISKSDVADSRQPFKDYKDCVPTVFGNIFQVDQSVGNEALVHAESTLSCDKR